MKVAVITISDRASRGEYQDLSGPEIEKALLALFPQCDVTRTVVPDEAGQILGALQAAGAAGAAAGAGAADFILTTGGTGISPRDVTPEVTARFCDKEIPGISEALRAASLTEAPAAMLSRGYAGLHGSSIVVNFPGSVKAVRLCMKVLGQVMDHAVRMLRGEGH